MLNLPFITGHHTTLLYIRDNFTGIDFAYNQIFASEDFGFVVQSKNGFTAEEKRKGGRSCLCTNCSLKQLPYTWGEFED